jgi:hypothetical protein
VGDKESSANAGPETGNAAARELCTAQWNHFVAAAEAEMQPIFEKWRERGKI